jgi:hypothetical protein
MKIAFYYKNKEQTTYTDELLKHIAKKNGHQVVDYDNADIIGISMTSHYELQKLRMIRKQYPGKKIIVGGHVGFGTIQDIGHRNYYVDYKLVK